MSRTVLTTAALAASCFVTGCAAPDLRALETATHARAKACCSDLRSLPASSPLAKENTLSLNATSPHFDFGAGLTPFASYKLDATVKYVALLSKPQGAQPFFFADLRPIFLDAQGRQLPPVDMSPAIVRTYGAMGWYALTRYAAVPQQAVTLVVTTDVANAGKSARTTGDIPSGGVMLGGIFVPMLGGQHDFPYFHAIYGDGWLLTSATAPR